MYAESINHWLKKRSRMEAAMDFLVGGFLVFCCIAVLGLTFGFGYLLGAVLLMVLSEIFGVFAESETLSVLFNFFFASLTLALVFMAHIRNERESRGDYDDLQFIAGRDAFFPWAMKVSVYTAGEIFGKAVADIVLIGPRLLYFTGSLFRRAVRLCSLDYWRCAQILEALVRRGKRMSFLELEQIVPDANRFHVFEQLRDIDGVVFLLSEPAGVSLVQDLRAELRGLPTPVAFNAPPPREPPRPEFHAPNGPPPVDLPEDLAKCYILLGISARASGEQIRDAYRAKIKECHPDRFMRFGKDWQRLAEERSKQINRAYEMIIAERMRQ